VTFRTRAFLGIFIASAVALGVSTLLVGQSLRRFQYEDIRESLLSRARLAAYLISLQPPLDDASIDQEADEIARLLQVRVTLLSADGRVLGESEADGQALLALENHAHRSEVEDALRGGAGTAIRPSATTNTETMYAAVLVEHGPVRFVRLSLPLTRIDESVASLRQPAVIGLAAGLLIALVGTSIASLLLNRRLRIIADTARRYMAGDFTRPARDHGSDELGTVANVLDATARELGARLGEMERERAHTDAILHGMVEGVLLVNRDGRLVLTNPAAQSMLQMPGPASDAHYLEVVRHPAIAATMSAVLSGRPAAPAEVDLGGSPVRRVMANVVPVSPQRGGGAVLVLHDITDLRHADQVRRDFVANVSHELRTPLTAIRGYVEALLDTPADADEAGKFLEVISRHTYRMERLVHDLLRLARLDAGQETVERTDCAVGDIIDAVNEALEPLLSSRGQQVKHVVAPEAARVVGDAAKLQDILRNLIENASNYSAENGTIEVDARRGPGGIEITVADRGPGIPDADLPRIFERFYRADRSRSRAPGGTGLGLSIVRHLVELHGGTISAANREGGGASFTLRLPDA
jgi:two-component system phosphate regulon sensor histidine kinase PhoR